MEFASFFNSMGVKVHVVEMMPEILGAMDKETSGMLRAEYAKRGVTFYLNTKVVEVNAHGVVIEKEGKVCCRPQMRSLSRSRPAWDFGSCL